MTVGMAIFYLLVGQCIVQYNRIEKRQRFIHAAEITDIITAFASGCGKK